MMSCILPWEMWVARFSLELLRIRLRSVGVRDFLPVGIELLIEYLPTGGT